MDFKAEKKHFRGKESRWFVTRQYVKHFVPGAKILDLGYDNELSRLMPEMGYTVNNTIFDLDKYPELLKEIDVETVTAFEILEHLTNPYGVLTSFPAGTLLLCSVPLRVWFAKPHWDKNDPLNCHYHEFLEREFRMLLDKTGYEIIFSRKECIVKNFGIRQILTFLFQVKRYLFVVAAKK